jgi:hypothetical protein
MSLEVFLHPSTTSPPPDGFEAAVDDALASIGAASAEDGEAVLLADGSTLDLYLDDQDDIALLTLDTVNESVAEAVYAVMAATRSFMLSAGYVCRIAETGGVIPSLAMSFPQAREIDQVELGEILGCALLIAQGVELDIDEPDEAELRARDAELEAAALAAAPPSEPEPIVSKTGTPLLQRLSDTLFGKSI